MSSRPALAVSLYVAGRRCVVVGDGEPAAERAARLREAGADVVTVGTAAFTADRVAGASLVVAADPARAAEASAAAHAAGALAYCVDRPELSDLAMPALARRGAVQLAVSTEGAAPALARRLRDELQRLLDAAGPALDAFVAELATLRASLPPGDRKERMWQEACRLAIEGRIQID